MTLEKAIEDIQEVQGKGDRPIIVKHPSGVLGKEHNFENCQAAIDFLKLTDGKDTHALSAFARCSQIDRLEGLHAKLDDLQEARLGLMEGEVSKLQASVEQVTNLIT